MLGVLGKGVETNRHKNAPWLEPRGICSPQSRISAEGREAGTQTLEAWSLMARALHCCSLLPVGAERDAGNPSGVSCSPTQGLLVNPWTQPTVGSRTTGLPDLRASVNPNSAPETQHLRSLGSFRNRVSLFELGKAMRSKFTQGLPNLQPAAHMRIWGISGSINLTFISCFAFP